MQRHIVLIGFMGTGKSTVGKLIAERLQWETVDTDDYVEGRYGMRIADMFRVRGERYFREREHEALMQLMQRERPLVVTTGGGIVLRADNVAQMTDNGWVVALTATRDVLVQRLKNDSTRPLLAGDVEAKVTAIWGERRTAYDFAHLKVDTSHGSPEAIAAHIVTTFKASCADFK